MFIRPFVFLITPEDFFMHPKLSEVVAMAVGAGVLVFAIIPFFAFILFR